MRPKNESFWRGNEWRNAQSIGKNFDAHLFPLGPDMRENAFLEVAISAGMIVVFRLPIGDDGFVPEKYKCLAILERISDIEVNGSRLLFQFHLVPLSVGH